MSLLNVMYVNPMSVIRDYIASLPEVFAEVDGRVYGGYSVPPENYEPEQGSAIVFNSQTGDLEWDGGVYRVPCLVKCYASTPLDSYSLYQVLHNSISR
ncbi:MAG: hypothetical protein V3S69_06980, partial [Dehalococcoidales bacterium]